MTNTKLVEHVKLVSESAISAGTRRIEALAGKDNSNAYLVKQLSVKKDASIIAINKINQAIKDSSSKELHQLNDIKHKIDNIQLQADSKQLEDTLSLFESLNGDLQKLQKKVKKQQSTQGQALSHELAKHY